jgi:hypothetical protein
MKVVRSKFTLWEDETIQTIVTGYRISSRWYELYEDGRLFIRAGFSWDGATGAFDTDDIIGPSGVHDIFCELINAGLLPRFVQALADEQFRLDEGREKMPWYRRMLTYFAVRGYQVNKKQQARPREVFEVFVTDAGETG